MKVLVTGGYGFIGSHVCEYFNREGHEVFVLDNLTIGKKDNLRCKHQHFMMSVEDPKCEEIFKSIKIDIVIHLASQTDDFFAKSNPYNDTMTNLIGLVNMLNLSSKYGVKRFIYGSTCDIYGTSNSIADERSEINPLSESDYSHLTGENYCKKWYRKDGLSTIILRLSNVYGPRMNLSGSKGIISDILISAEKDKKVKIGMLPSDAVDLIYIDDVVEAIYRASFIRYHGTLNISRGVVTEVKDVVLGISKALGVSDIEYMNIDRKEPFTRGVSNSKAKKILDWTPFINSNTGVSKMSLYLKNLKSDIDLKSDKKEKKTLTFYSSKKGIMPYIENIVAFSIVTTLYSLFSGVMNGFPVDLILILIIGFSIYYGSRQALFSLLLAVISHILITISKGRDPLMLAYSNGFFINLAFYVIVGFLIGYFRDRLVTKNQELSNEIEILDEKVDFLNGMYSDMRKVKDELQNQIANSGDSLGKIFSIVHELDTLRPDEVFAKAVSVIEKLLSTESVAIYKFQSDSHFARMMACSDLMGENSKKSIKLSDYPEVKSAISKKDIFVSKKMEEGRPVMVSPVYNKDDLIGGIVLFKADFERLTLSYQNYFKVITLLISKSLTRAYEFDEISQLTRYVEGTNILKPDKFIEALESKRKIKSNHKIDYSMIELKGINEDSMNESLKIHGIIRETDFIGIADNRKFYIVLGNTSEEEAGTVIDRLGNVGIEGSIVSEVV